MGDIEGDRESKGQGGRLGLTWHRDTAGDYSNAYSITRGA